MTVSTSPDDVHHPRPHDRPTKTSDIVLIRTSFLGGGQNVLHSPKKEECGCDVVTGSRKSQLLLNN